MPTVKEALGEITKQVITLLDQQQILTKKESKTLFQHFNITPDKVVYGLKTFAAPPHKEGKLTEYVISEGKKLTEASKGMASLWQTKATPPAVERARRRLSSGIAEDPVFLKELTRLLTLALTIIGE